MKKKIILRGMLGFPLGIALGYLITIFASLPSVDGSYSPCAPELTAFMGNELRAVMLQALLCGLLGSAFGAGSVIWDLEKWGLVKQTGLYFLLISFVMMPVAYISRWMEHSLKGVLGYFGIFILIFAVVWIAQYMAARRNVRKLNDSLRQRQNPRNES